VKIIYYGKNYIFRRHKTDKVSILINNWKKFYLDVELAPKWENNKGGKRNIELADVFLTVHYLPNLPTNLKQVGDITIFTTGSSVSGGMHSNVTPISYQCKILNNSIYHMYVGIIPTFFRSNTPIWQTEGYCYASNGTLWQKGQHIDTFKLPQFKHGDDIGVTIYQVHVQFFKNQVMVSPSLKINLRNATEWNFAVGLYAPGQGATLLHTKLL